MSNCIIISLVPADRKLFIMTIIFMLRDAGDKVYEKNSVVQRRIEDVSNRSYSDENGQIWS